MTDDTGLRTWEGLTFYLAIFFHNHNLLSVVDHLFTQAWLKTNPASYSSLNSNCVRRNQWWYDVNTEFIYKAYFSCTKHSEYSCLFLLLCLCIFWTSYVDVKWWQVLEPFVCSFFILICHTVFRQSNYFQNLASDLLLIQLPSFVTVLVEP